MKRQLKPRNGGEGTASASAHKQTIDAIAVMVGYAIHSADCETTALMLRVMGADYDESQL